MILPFSTQLNGKPTYFVEKIHKSLREIYFGNPALCAFAPNDFELTFYHKCSPKRHTIREDKNDRWHAGNKIDFFINCRQKDMFRFAPVLQVVSVQEVHIEWKPETHKGLQPLVWVDDAIFYDAFFKFGIDEMLQLAHNDGFDTIEDFFAYFNEDFIGKIIHWTDLKY